MPTISPGADAKRDRRSARLRSAGRALPAPAVRRRGAAAMVPLEELLQLAADHEPDDGVVADLARAQLAGVAAVAQHRDAVGDVLDLLPAGARCRRSLTPSRLQVARCTSKSRSVSRLR